MKCAYHGCHNETGSEFRLICMACEMERRKTCKHVETLGWYRGDGKLVAGVWAYCGLPPGQCKPEYHRFDKCHWCGEALPA